MSSCYSGNIRISIFGQSHSGGVGCIIDGLPAGEKIDSEVLQAFLNRRAPGNNAFSTARKEADAPEFLSGLVEGVTCGAPLCAVIRNTNTRSKDYDNIRDIPRPGHADYTAQVKYGGHQDVSGGGHFSGRLTSALCIAGGICRQILEKRGIFIGAHLKSIANVQDSSFDPVNLSCEDLHAPGKKSFPVINDAAGEQMQAAILSAKEKLDSVGGIIECAAVGLPAGLGDPMFDGMENRIARIIFAIPAVKGIEFGAGFASAALLGSENNAVTLSAGGFLTLIAEYTNPAEDLTVTFEGQTDNLQFYYDGGSGNSYAFLPIDPETPAGTYPLTVRSGETETIYAVTVEERENEEIISVVLNDNDYQSLYAPGVLETLRNTLKSLRDASDGTPRLRMDLTFADQIVDCGLAHMENIRHFLGR